ncbi:uncharacterized protein DEA37_0007411 [Paragonimus westermani]|uniref:Reverse transcriptase domain-containing protein n=1 Tax=Paragonimus westermani TaxID=34504 RepID=A0A5J4NX58_9TREM|nr:uncharacterized protein DEA37_0007411 [Paragonimus westermani]
MTATASAAAEELANFHSTVFRPKECLTLKLHPLLSPTVALQDMTVNAESVILILLGLNTKKSPGAEKITLLILKQCARSLYTSLTDLFNLSLNCSMVPMDWKCGTITSIFIGGDRSDVSNYRPVPLLPVIFKLLERLHMQHHKLYVNWWNAEHMNWRITEGTTLRPFVQSCDPSALQIDLDRIECWSEDWSLPLNDRKCAHMSLGGDSENLFVIYGAQSVVDITKVDLKKYLGIWLSSGLSFSYHHQLAAKRGLVTLGMIKRTFPRIDKRAFHTLYRVHIRPLLEYANQVVFTGLKKNILTIEHVQRVATKMVIGLVQQFFTLVGDNSRRGHDKKLYKL